ncbi:MULTISPECIES: lipopolysaccharide biosynthesis protein [Hyphomicrobium]|jgi:O-antigen/teichoic acid export membrane protein|uniref:lipopolysaccharide biosynthesis protein n=1 Tax=Hyphomicrobium TaxID=81 RepID=UPI000360C4F9|nr:MULTISPECIES: lipopolysaccharide biosynthesis protein [Hyphomicrobium]WBT38869.1 lipopolysaccharide biosynthesis protein [Hyphomicrobium sp. DMF-1]HML44477.1 lipopolysaccharide biosynthesis protein [Hyphomicrobium zavarzinii]
MIEARGEPLTLLKTTLNELWNSRAKHAASWNAIGVFAIRAASAALLFATQVVLARWMGASEYGLYVSAWTCVLVVGGISHLGFNVAMMRLAPQYQANQDYASFRGLLNGGRLVAIASAAAIAGVGLAALWISSTESGTALAVPMALALLCLPLYALTDVQDGLGRGQGWTIEAIGPPYIARPLMLLTLVLVVSMLGYAANAVTGMTIALAATLFAAVLQTVLLERRVEKSVPATQPAYAFSTWLKISLPLLAGSICDLVIQNADVLMLNLFRPSGEIGIYYAAAKTAGLALFVHYAVGSAYAGRIAAAHALGDNAQVRELVRNSVRWTFIPSAAVTLGILLVGYPVLAQFGQGFTDAYPLMFILAVGILAKAATGPADTILNMLGHQRASAISIGLAAVICVTLNLILIPLWSVAGAAVATATSVVAASAFNWYAARRLEGLNLFILANIKRPEPASR